MPSRLSYPKLGFSLQNKVEGQYFPTHTLRNEGINIGGKPLWTIFYVKVFAPAPLSVDPLAFSIQNSVVDLTKQNE